VNTCLEIFQKMYRFSLIARVVFASAIVFGCSYSSNFFSKASQNDTEYEKCPSKSQINNKTFEASISDSIDDINIIQMLDFERDFNSNLCRDINSLRSYIKSKLNISDQQRSRDIILAKIDKDAKSLIDIYHYLDGKYQDEYKKFLDFVRYEYVPHLSVVRSFIEKNFEKIINGSEFDDMSIKCNTRAFFCNKNPKALFGSGKLNTAIIAMLEIITSLENSSVNDAASKAGIDISSSAMMHYVKLPRDFIVSDEYSKMQKSSFYSEFKSDGITPGIVLPYSGLIDLGTKSKNYDIENQFLLRKYIKLNNYNTDYLINMHKLILGYDYVNAKFISENISHVTSLSKIMRPVKYKGLKSIKPGQIIISQVINGSEKDKDRLLLGERYYTGIIFDINYEAKTLTLLTNINSSNKNGLGYGIFDVEKLFDSQKDGMYITSYLFDKIDTKDEKPSSDEPKDASNNDVKNQ
jgi:hypothetical protein